MKLETSKVKEFASLAREKDELKAALAKCESKMKKLKPTILDMFMDADLQNMPIKFPGGETRTVFVAKIINAKLAGIPEGLSKQEADAARDAAKERLASALKKARLSYFVKEQVNMNSISAYVRERLGEGKQLPPSLADVLEVDEVVDLRVQKTAKSETASERASKTLNKSKGKKTANA